MTISIYRKSKPHSHTAWGKIKMKRNTRTHTQYPLGLKGKSVTGAGRSSNTGTKTSDLLFVLFRSFLSFLSMKEQLSKSDKLSLSLSCNSKDFKILKVYHVIHILNAILVIGMSRELVLWYQVVAKILKLWQYLFFYSNINIWTQAVSVAKFILRTRHQNVHVPLLLLLTVNCNSWCLL